MENQNKQQTEEAKIKLPIPGRRNILITSALPYVNNIPHLGNLIGCVLSADVFARYCCLRGYNAIFICGTDEYGTAIEIKAMQENSTPQHICDKYHAIHKEVYDWFDIKFDKFGRTSTPQQTEICQAIFKKLLENNWLSENITPQFYCEKCELFLADRLVEGTCPKQDCMNNSARGDQCDECDKQLNSIELIDPRCKLCHTKPQIRDTEHLFLELPLLEDKIQGYIDKMSVAGSWSHNAIKITYAQLREGLKPRAITRDLKWGVPVPHEKFQDKVFYVWFDAPIGYISITSCYTPDWEKWWKDPDNVELYQFMGKDNVNFHTVMFPSTLLGTGEKWTLMRTVSVTEFLTYKSGKLSKSEGVGIFGNDAKESNQPAEVWRYYLLANRPETSDTDFKWEDFQTKIETELLNNLGNFIHRVLSFIEGKGYEGVIPDAKGAESHSLTASLADKVHNLVDQYVKAMEQVKLKQGLRYAMEISSEGNAYLQATEFFKLYKEDQASCSIVLKTSVGLVYLLACLLEPFMPSFSVKVLNLLHLPPETKFTLLEETGNLQMVRRLWDIVPSGHKIEKPNPIFKKLTDDELKALKDKFSGKVSKTSEKLKRTHVS